MSVHLPDDVAARLKNSEELIPTIAQDYKSGEVLMLAYMNAQSLAITIDTGRATYWSRSRNELWEKGATSGHTQKVISISLDCDGELGLLVTPVRTLVSTIRFLCLPKPAARNEYRRIS